MDGSVGNELRGERRGRVHHAAGLAPVQHSVDRGSHRRPRRRPGGGGGQPPGVDGGGGAVARSCARSRPPPIGREHDPLRGIQSSSNRLKATIARPVAVNHSSNRLSTSAIFGFLPPTDAAPRPGFAVLLYRRARNEPGDGFQIVHADLQVPDYPRAFDDVVRVEISMRMQSESLRT